MAAFTGLAIDTAGTNDTLEISSGALTATINGLDVTPGAAAELAVTTQPSATLTAGSRFGLIVAAEDAFGNMTTAFNGSVTVALGGDPDGVALNGTTTLAAAQGVAVFTGLAVDTAGSGYTLQASGHGLTSTTATALSVIPGPAAQLVVTTPPPETLAAGSRFGLTVSAEDTLSNVVTNLQRYRFGTSGQQPRRRGNRRHNHRRGQQRRGGIHRPGA